MSRNGSGTYTLPTGPVITGTTITSSWANTTMQNIADGLTQSVASDGQTPMSGALNMATNKITSLGTPTVATDASTKDYVDTAISGLGSTYLAKANNLSDVTSTSTSRTNLGLGTIATQAASAVAVTGGTIDGTTVGSTTRSTVKATTLDLGLSTQSVSIGQGNASAMKNRIINGAMVIDQRNAGATITAANLLNGSYTVDRWQYIASQTSKFSFAQNANFVNPPTGFNNYAGLVSASAYAITTTDYFGYGQKIEGFNFSDLGWGTANAKTVTLSFQVYSSLTGTFGGSIQNNNSSRSYPFTYSIPVANAWTQISVTVAGDTSGTWLGATNGIGAVIWFGLGVGSTFNGTSGAWASANYLSATGATSVVGTASATFYITGVQLEVGSSATGFEYRQYQQELALCQRYYQGIASGSGEFIVGGIATAGAQTAWSSYTNSVVMRASPTSTIIGSWTLSNATAFTVASSSQYGIRWSLNSSGAGQFYAYNATGGAGYSLSAEL